MSARHPLLHLPLTGNHRRLRPQWWMNGKHGQRNGTTLCLLVNPVSTCSITMVGFEFGDTEGEVAELLRYALPHWSCTRYHGMGWNWISLPHPSSLFKALNIQ
ncbi:hypothetical protein TNCV_1442101 [Trichonephila clavipes]|uniref:Uncharacterized protein n=1 Tax=Trichonephila clavipes TaxID=2585209 RepID=A0A8X6RJM9_TRICX|nr:hypothetical protein TNCV_1442101 [Trichonephila clavipes]